MGRRDSLVLVGNLSNDGVTRKKHQLGTCYKEKPLMSEMTQHNDLDNGINETGANCEGFSLGRCPMAAQHGPSRYPATARIGWSKSMNIYNGNGVLFFSKPIDDVGGYRRRMNNIWNERQTLKVTEQRLCD